MIIMNDKDRQQISSHRPDLATPTPSEPNPNLVVYVKQCYFRFDCFEQYLFISLPDRNIHSPMDDKRIFASIGLPASA